MTGFPDCRALLTILVVFLIADNVRSASSLTPLSLHTPKPGIDPTCRTMILLCKNFTQRFPELGFESTSHEAFDTLPVSENQERG